MTRSHSVLFILFAALLVLLTSCARPVAVELPTPTTIPSPAAATATANTPHAAEIRFALVGNVTSPNVWALFDSSGYSYNNYAVRSGYWPRLYRLTIPDGQFQPQAAAGMPSPVQPEGALLAATVALRTDLKWTDGSPFTAEDVAFTVNTALAFQLGFDWRAYYDPSWLDHAEAVDAHTVKFYFKKAPNVAAWQYGALQGPVVQKAYWSPKITASAAMLPTTSQLAQLDSLNAQLTDLQKSINDLITAGATASGEQARQLQIELQHQQGNLDGLQNSLTKAHGFVDSAMESARQSLYAVSASDDRTLGFWMPAAQSSSTWTNSINPSHPFGSPSFDRAVYNVYPDEASAAAALKDGQVNGILEPGGLSPALAAQGIPGADLAATQDSDAHFLVINPSSPALTDPALRRALFCSVDRKLLASHLQAMPLVDFVPGHGFWSNPVVDAACGTGYDPSATYDPSRAVDILKAAGYTWVVEPGVAQPGSGLTQPNGQSVPAFTLLAPWSQDSAEAQNAAQDIVASWRSLGLTVRAQAVDPADIRYAIFSDHNYDVALVGWRLSAYPGYLCDWFGDGNPFGYSLPQVRSDCSALAATSSLDDARQLLFDVQFVLSQDPPFVPLFSGKTYDFTRAIVYPFDHVLNGLSGVYGAPDLAIPSSP